VKDVTLPNGYIVKDVPNNYMVISTSELSFHKYECAIVSAMVKMFKRKQADPTFYLQRLFGAYAASNPTIPTACQEIMIYTARHTMMLDVASLLSDPKHQAKFSKLFLSVDNVCNLSPSARTLDHDIDDLAVLLEECAAQASTQQNCERLVYKATQVNLTGKSERRADALLIASNGFSVTFIANNATSDEDDNEEEADEKKTTKK
jgi:hypothetical protein